MISSWKFKALPMIFFLGIVLSCSSNTREDKMAQYLKKLGIPETSFVGLLNPGYCGSCTEYSIHWLASKKTSAKKAIVITSELKKEHRAQLQKAGYSFFNGDQNVMARNGITLSACTTIDLVDGEIESMKVIK